MTETKIERIGKVWFVTGVIAVIGGKIVNEPIRKACKTQKQAEQEVWKIDRMNVLGLEYYRERQAARMRQVSEYMAKRAARAAEDARQGSLFS